jgi:outer membrane protein assembly factor BamB
MRVRWLVLLAVVVVGAAACDWTQFGFGPERLRSSPDGSISTLTVPTLHLAWKATPNGVLTDLPASPIVVSGTVYLPASDDVLHGYDAAGVKNCSGTPKTCTDVWRGEEAFGVGRVSPSAGGAVVYVGSTNGVSDIYAYSRDDPRSDWISSFPGSGIVGAPTLSNGYLYTTSVTEHPRLSVFDAVKKPANCDDFIFLICKPIWIADAGNNGSEPTVAGGVVYIGTVSGLAAFDAAGSIGCGGAPKTCTPLWTATGGAVDAIAVTADSVYAVSPGGDVSVFDAHAGAGCSGTPKHCAPLWTEATGSPTSSSPAIAGNTLLLGSSDGKLYAFDARGITGCSGTPKTCTPLWTAATGGRIDSSPSVAHGVVYVGSDDGKLYAFDAAGAMGCSGAPKKCSPLWSYATGGAVNSSPAVANGFVYVGSDDGSLYAFSL